jgi:hypothetical protein
LFSSPPALPTRLEYRRIAQRSPQHDDHAWEDIRLGNYSRPAVWAEAPTHYLTRVADQASPFRVKRYAGPDSRLMIPARVSLPNLYREHRR